MKPTDCVTVEEHVAKMREKNERIAALTTNNALLTAQVTRLRRYVRASLALSDSYATMLDSADNATRHAALAEEFHAARAAMLDAGDVDDRTTKDERQ